MLQKAIRVQAVKEPLCNPIPSAEFMLLSSLSDDYLLAIASNSDLALLPGVGSCGGVFVAG
jgi:hypothetical protein